VGLVTISTVPFVYWRLDNDVASARFFTEEERAQAIERLRANQTGTGSRELRWDHIREAALEPKTYLWIGMALLLNVGAAVTNTFGPLILKGLGFDKYLTSLLNMPFGAVQFLVIIIASYAAQKARIKSAVLAGFMLPVIAGAAMLYVLRRTHSEEGPLLAGYYLLAFLFAGNPLIVTWIVGNTAGTTKKSMIMSLYNAGSSSGNIIGPLLFATKDAPSYHPGLRSVLAIFCTLVAVVGIQFANLVVLNKLQAKKRVANGKRAVIHDYSMEDTYHAMDEDNETEDGSRLGEEAFMDLTDRKNDEFTYIY
jgi:Major Facilitator Superfamily